MKFFPQRALLNFRKLNLSFIVNQLWLLLPLKRLALVLKIPSKVEGPSFQQVPPFPFSIAKMVPPIGADASHVGLSVDIPNRPIA